ncbi:MAG: hypothetical protein A2798_02055 [Candidatus Levybacteria bacterium RIFCSPHIGHO2_01_FULL_37_17]|nr:MAG: hypothetical protein A2798_02055 [Candidatus Levybacteria bacterium RIFCSPHIGHO2_01_FULL_37_17]OGH36662.1 MAG: hypothetical protein A2959_00045 [Candidatus Levybacteria bacterium RIFCSPLOWO2_01_FULL_38_23]
MDSIDKINFDTPTQKEDSTVLNNSESFNTNTSMTLKNKLKKFFSTRRGRRSLIVTVVIIAFLILVTVQGLAVYAAAKATYAQAKLAIDAVKKQNISLASSELSKTKEKLLVTQKALHSMVYLKFIPIASWYYNDADHLVNAGFHGLDGATILIKSVEPYADLLGLKGQGSFVGGTAQQRVETAVKTMGKITPNIDKIADKLSLAQKEIDQVKPGHYPAIGPGAKVRNGLENLKTMADQGVSVINSSKPLIKILPELLGEPKEKKYLILFQNDKELRPTGGFLTAYSIFRLDSGVVHVDNSSDIYNLDDTISGKQAAPEVIQKYLEVRSLNLRDSNLSPDFKVSMEEFTKLYNRAPGKVEVDGIIAVDTQALVAAMNILGDIQAAGKTFTTKEDPRCGGCPQVIYELEDYSSRPVGYVRTERKDLIGVLMYEIMNKAFSSSPKIYWGPLFQAMLAQMSEKHILFNMYDAQAQKGLEAFSAAGRIIPFEGDYLHINQANLGGAKSNMFVSWEVTEDYQVGSDGVITKTVTLDYKNPYPPSDCNLERGNLCLNAVLRDWVRVYVPKGSKLVDSVGSEVTMKTYEELGKTVFEGFLTVRPKGTAKLKIIYKLPFKLAEGSTLPLLIQKQPGTLAELHTINSGSKKLEQFSLSSDKTLNLKVR